MVALTAGGAWSTTENTYPGNEPSYSGAVVTAARLFKNWNYVLSVIAQFAYVGTQITVWTYTNYYIPEQIGVSY